MKARVLLTASALILGTCFTASSRASVKVIAAPTKATVTTGTVASLPAQWTVTTAVTATTSAVAATPTIATITTTSTIFTNASASAPTPAPEFDKVD